MRVPVVLTIAGSDPSGGAGIQADQRVIELSGCACVSMPTALTSQNTLGVDAVFPVPIDVFRSQLESLLSDIRPNAVKIGLLPSREHVISVVELIRKYDLGKIVLDPVFAPTAGKVFLDFAGIQELSSTLVPNCRLVTPNLDEAFMLGGISISTEVDMERAAGVMLSRGAQAVLIKGGHLTGAPNDLLATRSGNLWLPGRKVETQHTHGTGCFLSSAIASGIAAGNSLEDAVSAAKESLSKALETPRVIGKGRGYPSFFSAFLPKPENPRGIYYITDDRRGDSVRIRDSVLATLRGGVKTIQLRAKNLPPSDLADLARLLRGDTNSFGALLIINDRVDIALACDADGVHLGPDDMSPRDVRAVLHPNKLVGISAGSMEEIAAYGDISGASYIGCGPVFGTKTKGDAGAAIGIERLREMKAALPHLPIIAIGGITADNIAAVRDTGVAGAAVVSAISQADDPEGAARNLVEMWNA